MRAPEQTFSRARTLRRAMSLPEVLLWRDLRRNGMDGLRLRRQHPVGPYVLDFYRAPARLAVEIDGAAHDHPDRAARGLERDAWLEKRGISVLRFMANDILHAEARDGALPRSPPPFLPRETREGDRPQDGGKGSRQ